MRSDGGPSGVVVASAIALASLGSPARASASQLSNRAKGSSLIAAVIMRPAFAVERDIGNLTVLRHITTWRTQWAFTPSHLSGYRSKMADPYSTLGVAKDRKSTRLNSSH